MPKKPKDAEWYKWTAFLEWSENNGISLDCEEDWTPWWNCWKAGYSAAMQ